MREGTLLVERAISLGEVKETRTRRIRAVRLLAPLADDLAVWRELSEGDRDSLVFPNRRGQVWTDDGYRYWRRRVFDAAAREAEVAIGRPYDLRHAFVSLLLAEGRSVVYVASQAGHAPSMTLDTYAHVIEELETGERVPGRGCHLRGPWRAGSHHARTREADPESTRDHSWPYHAEHMTVRESIGVQAHESARKLRHRLLVVPDRVARQGRRARLRLTARWPWHDTWLACLKRLRGLPQRR